MASSRPSRGLALVNRPGLADILQAVKLFRDIYFLLLLLRWTRTLFFQLRGVGIAGTVSALYNSIERSVVGLTFKIPRLRQAADSQIADAMAKIEEKFGNLPPGVTSYRKIPKIGMSEEQIIAELQQYAGLGDINWKDGRVSGTVYHGGKDLTELQCKAYSMFAVTNPLHPGVFPGVRKMEAEIVAMVLELYNAPVGAGGTTTSGGTESILMACKAWRDKAYHERGVDAPEMIVPVTAHAAFDKAAEYFKIKLRHAPIDPVSLKVDLHKVSRLINRNTVMIVGSAPNFPFGTIDDIAALSRIAIRRRVPLHVDACLGSFIVPYLEKAGYPTEPFDFRLEGVSSISCDVHKYGFAPKGTSTIMYRRISDRRYQYFIAPEWLGGVYASPSMAGSRPGALLAGCWASLMSQGESGYIAACHGIVGAAKKIERGIRDNLAPDLHIMGYPITSVVAFSSKSLNIYEVGDRMTHRGWELNGLQTPPALHIACTMLTISAVDTFLQDLKEVVAEVKLSTAAAIAEGINSKGDGDMVALYGVADTKLGGHLGIVPKLAEAFLDALYKV